jgi:hypothetical protein
MIERVARAIALWDGSEWDGAVGGQAHIRNRYRKQAIAAVEAMREPTESMVDAGAEHCRDIDADELPHSEPRRGAHDSYQAMIDSVLDEKSES